MLPDWVCVKQKRLKHVQMSFDELTAQPPYFPMISITFSVTLHGNSSIKAIAIFTYNDLSLFPRANTRETMILNKFLHSEYTRNWFHALLPPGDPRNPCASHVKKERAWGNGNLFIPSRWAWDMDTPQNSLNRSHCCPLHGPVGAVGP